MEPIVRTYIKTTRVSIDALMKLRERAIADRIISDAIASLMSEVNVPIDHGAITYELILIASLKHIRLGVLQEIGISCPIHPADSVLDIILSGTSCVEFVAKLKFLCENIKDLKT